jgi:hypothetical protein
MAETVQWWIEWCRKAAAEAYAGSVMEVPTPPEFISRAMETDPDNAQWSKYREPIENRIAAHEAASAAYQVSLPPLIDRHHTKAYIACVAAGLQHKYLTTDEAKRLMYAGQLALAAFRPRVRKN